MTLDQEELELTAIRFMIASQESVVKMRKYQIEEGHFDWIPTGSEASPTRTIFRLANEYYEQSDGCLLTENVLVGRMVERKLPEERRQQYMILWSKIQEIDADPNEVFEVCRQLKQRYAMRTWRECLTGGHEVMAQQGLATGIEYVQERLDLMRTQLLETMSEKREFDFTRSAEKLQRYIAKRLRNPEKFSGIPCGISEIDNRTHGFLPEQLIVLLAASSGGKSVQMLNFGEFANKVAGKNVIYFSFEMSDELCHLRHLSLRFNVSYDQLKGMTLETEELDALVEDVRGLEGSPYFFYDCNTDNCTSEYIDTRIRELTQTIGKPDMVIVDYIGKMTSRRAPKGAKKHEREEYAIEELHSLAQRHQLVVLTAQQLNRDTIRDNRKAKESGKAAAFAQDATSGSQVLMHLAHFVIGLEGLKDQCMTVYHGVKMRDAEFVPCASHWDADHNRATELSPEEMVEFRMDRGLYGESSINGEQKNTASARPNGLQATKLEGGGVKVEYDGGARTFEPEELMLDASDWDLTLGLN